MVISQAFYTDYLVTDLVGDFQVEEGWDETKREVTDYCHCQGVIFGWIWVVALGYKGKNGFMKYLENSKQWNWCLKWDIRVKAGF